MADVELELNTELNVLDAWRRLTDFAAHARVIPLTTIVTDPGRPRLGWQFIGVTSLGPMRFEDPMVISVWEPPAGVAGVGCVRLVKTGRWLQGWAEITVEPSGLGTRVRWSESLRPRPDPAPAITSWVARSLGTRLFESALRGLLGGESPSTSPSVG
jgi:carbon monoxide dehydrogenase subunit G